MISANASMRNSAMSIQTLRMSIVVRARMPLVTTPQEASAIWWCMRASIENARTVARPRIASSTRWARTAIAARSSA